VLSFFLTLLRDLGCLRIMVFGSKRILVAGKIDSSKMDNFWVARHPNTLAERLRE